MYVYKICMLCFAMQKVTYFFPKLTEPLVTFNHNDYMQNSVNNIN